MIIMGIDPGFTGGIVVLNDDREILAKYIMPIIESKKVTVVRATKKRKTKTTKKLDFVALKKIFDEWDDFVDFIFLELVSSRPGEGVSSVFKFGRSFGAIEGIAAVYSPEVELVTPRTWTKTIHEGVSRQMNPKDRSKVILDRLFPKIDLKRSQRCKNQHEGMMDALLIAEYGLRSKNQ